MPDLSITTRQQGDTTRIVVAGDLDAATARGLSDAVELALQQRPLAVIVDLSGTEFMDSAGVRVLVGARNAVDETGALFEVQQVQRAPRRVLEMTGLAPLLNVRDPDG